MYGSVVLLEQRSVVHAKCATSLSSNMTVASILVYLGESSVGNIAQRGKVVPFVYGIHQVHKTWFPDCGDQKHTLCQIVLWPLLSLYDTGSLQDMVLGFQSLMLLLLRFGNEG